MLKRASDNLSKFRNKTTRLEIICLILFFTTFFSVPLLLHRENRLLCYGIELNSKIVYFLWLLLLLVEITTLFFKKSGLIKILIFATIILILFQILFFTTPSIGKPMDAKRVADLRQIHVVQLVFFSENQRYAVNQHELVENGYLSAILTDPMTDKEYTDADGVGLEGGDDNPLTFLVQAALEGNHTHEICSKKEMENIFICTQGGCEYKRK